MKVCSVCHRCFDDAVFSCIEHDDTELSSIRQGYPGMVSGYRLERMTERGGIAESYLAHHLKSGRVCLIKIFSGSSDRREQFLRDAETATSSFDPNIADVYETGSLENGDLYLVSEQVSGRSLRKILDNGGVDLLTAVKLIRQAAETVHSLHLKGIIHRAISPENIVVSDGNAVRLTNVDFGGMVEHSIVSDKFTIGLAVNELRYFAPEQFSGKETGIKTDVYSLGVVFYEMLTGRPPFQHETAAGLIEMHRTQRPADVTIDDFDLRMLITHTLMESLNKHPENRQSSANAFARQLRHVEQLATHVSTPPPAVNLRVPAHAAVVVSQPLPAPEINKHDDSKQIPVIKQTTPQYVNTPAPPISHYAAAERAAPPAESRLSQFRRRSKRHRPGHDIDSSIQKETTIESSVPKPVEELPVAVLIEPPPQETEVAAPAIQPAPAQPKAPKAVEENVTPTDVPQSIAVPIIRQTKDIVITNPRKLGLREVVSTTPPNTAHHEPDEITAATARSRPVRIPVERQRRSNAAAAAALFKSSVDNLFFPTLFGGSATSVAESSSMFSGFYGEMPNRNSIVPRVIKVGGLVVAIASLVLIGKQFTGELRSEAAPVAIDSSHTVSPSARQPIAEAQDASKHINETTSANLSATTETVSSAPKTVKSSIDREPAKTQSSFSDEKTVPKVDSTRSKPSPESRTSKPAKAEAAKRTLGSERFLRTAKTDPKTQSSMRTANKPIAQNKPGATTRPRIVANPRP